MNRLMMKLFVASEAIFFVSLMVAYVYFWISARFGTEALARLDIVTSGVFTGMLVLSSGTLWMSERSRNRGKRTAALVWLGATLLLGAAFLAGQSHEYYRLLSGGFTIGSDEFGTSFFTLTGFHGLHLLLGLLTLGTLMLLLSKGYLDNDRANVMATAGIYWHFVDAVWVVVFTLIYVFPHIAPHLAPHVVQNITGS